LAPIPDNSNDTSLIPTRLVSTPPLTRLGVLVNTKQWLWPSLLPLFIQMRVGVMIYWGQGRNTINKKQQSWYVPDFFRPTEADITSATLISSKVVKIKPVAGMLC
jgi:hypothetical protein